MLYMLTALTALSTICALLFWFLGQINSLYKLSTAVHSKVFNITQFNIMKPSVCMQLKLWIMVLEAFCIIALPNK